MWQRCRSSLVKLCFPRHTPHDSILFTVWPKMYLAELYLMWSPVHTKECMFAVLHLYHERGGIPLCRLFNKHKRASLSLSLSLALSLSHTRTHTHTTTFCTYITSSSSQQFISAWWSLGYLWDRSPDFAIANRIATCDLADTRLCCRPINRSKQTAAPTMLQQFSVYLHINVYRLHFILFGFTMPNHTTLLTVLSVNTVLAQA